MSATTVNGRSACAALGLQRSPGEVVEDLRGWLHGAQVMGVDSSDWRRQGQERFLTGVTLARSVYTPWRRGWDHDHCEFCYRKFAVEGGDFNVGYHTLDRYHWVCDECFSDFSSEFKWKVSPQKYPPEV